MDLSATIQNNFTLAEQYLQREVQAGVNPRDKEAEDTSGDDIVTLSPEGRKRLSSKMAGAESTEPSSESKSTARLQHEQAELQELKQRDSEVRRHEQAHLAAAGRFARGGASFSFTKGSDGASYAISGEVGIDVSKASSPEATITKMQVIKRAALAPQNPSSADRRIAAQASMKEAKARKELLLTQQEAYLLGENSSPEAAANNTSWNNQFPTYSSLEDKPAPYTVRAVA